MENICLNLTINKNIKSKMETKLEKLNINFDNYIESLIKKDIEFYIEFDEGFFYDLSTNKLLNRFKTEITFTRLERNLFNLLLKEKGRIVSSDEIKEIVWRDREMSIFSLRNVIKKIRDKTYKDIIKTYSSNGYKIN